MRYAGIYPGVDVLYYGTSQGQFEYDFVIEPGGSPDDIVLGFDGVDAFTIDEAGDLRLATPIGELVQQAPVAFQEDPDGMRLHVACRYEMLEPGRVGFTLGDFDAGRPLIIDPVLIYRTLVGGGIPVAAHDLDQALDVAVDGAGNAYVAGITTSLDFPVENPAQGSFGGGATDAFVFKLDPTGSSLVFSTYLGGGDFDLATGIAVDSSGVSYVTGHTYSVDFPTVGAFQPSLLGAVDAFVVKLSSAGSQIVRSTYLGGERGELSRGIALDPTGAVVVVGTTYSPDFPVTAGALQTAFMGGVTTATDAFIAKFDPNGSTLAYATFLGGSGSDAATGVAVDSAGNAAVVGYTSSLNFPVQNAIQLAYGSQGDSFVSKLDAGGTTLAFSTYLGGRSEDSAWAVAVDASGSVYVAGETYSPDFPATVGAFQTSLVPSFSGWPDAFVTKFDPAGAISYSTFLGSDRDDLAVGIAVDSSGSAYVAGRTGGTLDNVSSTEKFPTQNPIPLPPGPILSTGFLTRFDANGANLLYSTFLDVRPTAVAVSDADAFVAGLGQAVGADPFVPADALVLKVGPDLTLPETTITAGPSGRTSESSPIFEFVSNESPDVAFQCSLDSAAFADCSSPHQVPTIPTDGSHSFRVQAIDLAGNVDPTPAERSFVLDTTNAPPDAVADAFLAVEDAALSVTAAQGVLANDGDPDGDSLTSELVAAPAHGEVTLALDGSFVYLAAPDFSGSDSFSYSAFDGIVLSPPAVVSIFVVPLNDRPSASDDSFSLSEDSTLTVPAAGVLANDLDVEGDSLTAVLVSGPAHGSVMLDGAGAFTYTPFANFFGTDSFRYAASDASSESDPATVTLTVTAVNDAVIPQSDSFMATEDTSLSIEAPGLLGNDTDPDGDALAVMLVSPPSNGTLSLAADGSFVYTPDANFFGTDTFTYTVGDGTTLSEPITVTLSVAAAADSPLTQPDSYTVEEDGLLTVLADAGVLANDSDPDGSGLSATLIDLPADGSISFAASGAFTYQPPPDFHGSSSFTYLAWNDSFSSSLVTVSLTVTSADDIPLAASDFVTTDQDIPVTVRVLENDVGLGDAPISLALSAPPINGNASVNADRTISYTPAFYFAGQDQFSYTVTDADGQSSGATTYVTVEPAQATGPGNYGAHALATAYGPTREQCNKWDESVNTPGYGWVIGSTSEYALASCAPRGIGPFSEAAVTMGAKTWRVEANAAGSGGNSQQGAGALSDAYAVDTYTVLKGTSGLPANAEVPLFIRLHLAADVQNTGPGTYPGYPSAYVQVHPFLQRYVSADPPTTFHGGAFRFTITEEKYMDIPLRSVPFGTRFRAFWMLTAFAESGIGADPKIAEAAVDFSLCSSAPGVQVIGASGTDGDCGGDIKVSYAEAVQSVFGASTLVAGKDTAVAVHLGNDFDRPVETKVSFRVERSGLSPAEITEIVTIPANCPSKRYYFPNPDPTFASVCDLASDALGVLPAEVEPIPGTDWRVSVTALTVDNLIETNATNNLPPAPPITYSVKETTLAPVYVRVHCMAGDCVTDPTGYGTLDNTEYGDAIFWSDLHAQAMLPLGPLYDPTRCTDSGSDCVISGDSQKCPGPATEASISCPGITADIQSANALMDQLFEAADMPVMVLPSDYWRYHQHNEIGGETFRRDPRDIILIKAELPSGSNAHNAHLPGVAHELAHWADASLQDTPQAAIPVHGYWVGCKQATLDPSLSCETPPDAENLMGFLSRTAPGAWIELDTYEAVLAAVKTTPDPPRLVIYGTLSRDGVPTVQQMFDLGSGKVDRSDGNLVTIEVIDDSANVLASLPIGSLAKFDDSSSAPGVQRTDILGMNPRIPYPTGAALVRFRRGSEIVLTVDPLSGTLRSAIDAIPSRGYDRNAEQRKKALLNKIDAFEKILAEDKPGAREKLRHDIRKSVEEWVIEYAGTALELSKAKILALIDSIDARLEARIRASQPPASTPQP